jgi:hypothetical protein
MGSVHSLPQEAANEPGAGLARPIQITSARFVTIELAAILTGLSEGAIRMKKAKGVWLEGRQWVLRDGRVLIDMEGYERWAETGRA